MCLVLTEHDYMNNRTTLNDIVLSSELSNFEKQELIYYFHFLQNEDELQTFVDLFQKDSNWIKRIYYILITKQKAIQENDTSLWQRILEEEQKEAI